MEEEKKIKRKKARQSQQQLQTEAVEQIADDTLESLTSDEPKEETSTAMEQVERLQREDKAEPKKARMSPSFKTKNGESLKNSVASEILLFGVVLMAIAAIVAGLLGFINSQTAPIIAGHKEEKRQTALQEIFPDADVFEEYSGFVFSNENVDALYVVKEDNDIVGYCVSIKSKGYSGTPIELIVGSDVLNKVTSVKVVSHSETPGIGESVIMDNGFMTSFIGQSKYVNYSDSVTAVSGATFTKDGIKNGINDALDAIDEVRMDMNKTGKEG